MADTMLQDISDYKARWSIESADKWRDWVGQIPFIKFPADWEVAMSPPFGGAVARFRVKLPSGTIKSIYFDAYDRRGCYGSPYWEVYPCEGDIGRCDLADTETLLSMIADESPETA